MKHQDALDQLARETKRARRRLTLERALRLALPALLLALAWAALALFGLHQRLPLLLQSLSAIAVVGAIIALGVFAFRKWKPVREDEARTRLAADCKLDLGAFEALNDRPSRYDPFSVALWRREQDQAYERAGKAKAGPARPKLDQIDRFKLRYIFGAAVLAGLIFAGGAATDRLALAFLPDPSPLLGDQPMAVEAWATPADYTHAPPISLSDHIGERIETPPSVDVTVRVSGPVGAPTLVFDGSGPDHRMRFVETADGAWEARMSLASAGTLKIVRFHTRASWRISPAPDRAPSALFVSPLAQLSDEHVSFGWRASDDFGVSRLVLRVTPVRPPRGLAHAAPVDTPVEVPAGEPQEAEAEAQLDLADHPYAGMEVEARVVAIDAPGQEGASEAMRFELPEKIFLQPLARAAIEIRRHILTDRRAYRAAPRERRQTIQAGDLVVGNQRIELRDYDRNPAIRRAPEGIKRAARLLDALMMEPSDGYFRDLAVFMGFRMARSELNVAQNIDATEVAADILWRTALRAEYGGAADARRALEMAQQQLAEALANRAPQERIRQLMEALRRATDNYLQALTQEAIRNGETAETQEDTEDQASITERDIQQMMQRVQELSEEGRTEEAQQLLETLANILQSLDARLTEGEQQQGENGEQSEQQQQMQQSMDQLSQTMGEQRALRDDTQQRQSGGGEQQGGQDLAERQSQLQQALGEAQRQSQGAGAAPSEDLNAAQTAMRQAENALRQGNMDAAQAAQNAALEHLREGADELAAQMRDEGREGEGGEEQGARDPLGRSLRSQGGGGDGEDTHVPTDIDPARSREIMDEIRRRAGDANRPEQEREYLRRLLDRFSGT